MPIKEEAPKGVCGKCGMVKMSREGISICPQCDTQSEPSGLTNNLADPGHQAMAKILEVQNPADLPPAKERTVTASTGAKSKVEIVPIHQYPLQEALRIVELASMPDNMADIKKLLKVKKLLQELVKEK